MAEIYADGTIGDYLEAAASGRATPGGGSVSALAGALATTMGSMAGNFTVGKKKYADVEGRVKEVLAALEEARTELLRLVDEDVRSYGAVAAAMQLPKETDQEKAARREALQASYVTAMGAPRAMVASCLEVLRRLATLVDIANRYLLSDVGVAAVLAEAALRGAKLNVDLNLAFIRDEDLVASTRTEVEAAAEEARRLEAEIAGKVSDCING